ncbi:hypothetical protein, partial [Faecalibaculum rodentium]|uniref:hypothetical protein n=1 Tax=Faecalibaculum rodentium TaxID=1702221 RepID=UPI003F4D3C1A
MPLICHIDEMCRKQQAKAGHRQGLPRCIRLLSVWSAVLQQSGVQPACFFDLRRKKAARPAFVAAAVVT